MGRRGQTGLSGVIVVDKPAGMTSHDVVSRVRRVTGEGRVGHAGTLDPMATGVLVVLIGPATRLAPLLTAEDKSYQARIVFGSETDTDDAEGEVTRTAPVDPALADPAVAAERVSALLGEHEQVPPDYSAIKVEGKTAYRAARAGEALDLASRTVSIHGVKVIRVEEGPPVTWDIELAVSKGTYVRALARDLGRDAGTAAHLGALRRTASGAFTLHHAITLDALEADPLALARSFVDPVAGLGLPVIALTPETAPRIAVGAALPATSVPGTPTDAKHIAIADESALHAIYRRSGDTLVADIVFPVPVTRVPR